MRLARATTTPLNSGNTTKRNKIRDEHAHAIATHRSLGHHGCHQTVAMAAIKWSRSLSPVFRVYNHMLKRMGDQQTTRTYFGAKFESIS
jgi:hypothetical protein